MMKKKKQLQILGMITWVGMLVMSCSNDPYDNWLNEPPGYPGQGNKTNDDNTATVPGTLLDFEIAIDESDTSGDNGSDIIPTDKDAETYDAYVENSTFTKTVTIRYTEGGATIKYGVDGVSI